MFYVDKYSTVTFKLAVVVIIMIYIIYFFLTYTPRTLLKLFNEIHYWEKLMFETPHYVSDLNMKKEDLRILRENVLLVVRDYNRSVP